MMAAPILFLLLQLLLSHAIAAATNTTSRPNVVVLVVDDIGYADFGFLGSNFPTPNIDRLAAEGVVLDRMYAMPQCSPTRSAVMTGRFAFRQGMQHWTTLMPGTTAAVPKEYSTIADVMKGAGYATHAIGKWHLGYASKKHIPTGIGFDTYLGYLQGQTDYYNHTIPACSSQRLCQYRSDKDSESPFGPDAAGYDFWDADKDGLRSMSGLFGNYTMDIYMSRFEKILKEADNAPFFVYFAEQTLHIPLQLPPSPEHAEACKDVKGGTAAINRTVLCAMASKLDAAVGDIDTLLKKYNLWDNTVVWLYSDNGGMTHWSENFPASASSNWPLRGGKTTVFEGGVRSVSIVFGGALPEEARGSRRSNLLHAVDILPTVAALGNIDVTHLSGQIDGLNAWDAISGRNDGAANRTELPLQIAVNEDLHVTGGDIPCLGAHCQDINYTALIVWPYKLILGDPFITAAGMAGADRGGYWTVENYAYIEPPEAYDAVSVRLYNLEEDEREQSNLASQHPDIVQSMTDRVRNVWLSKDLGYRRPQLNLPHIRGNPRLHNWTWAPFELA